jgi:hypothetical protein
VYPGHINVFIKIHQLIHFGPFPFIFAGKTYFKIEIHYFVQINHVFRLNSEELRHFVPTAFAHQFPKLELGRRRNLIILKLIITLLFCLIFSLAIP